MKRKLRRIASLTAALAFVMGASASPLGLASAQADSGLTISGNVVGDAGHLVGISVSGCTTDWNFCTDSIVTDASGTFVLSGLESGDYVITLDGRPTYQWGYYVGPGLTQDYGSATLVPAGTTLTNIQPTVALKISGTLTGAAGGLSKLTVGACAYDAGCDDGTVDDDGNFVVAGLSPGTYILNVTQTIGGMFLDGSSPYVHGFYDGTSITRSRDAALSIVVTDGDVSVPTFNVPIGAVLTGALSGSNGSLNHLGVEVCSDSGCSYGYTNPSGSYAISGLWPDDYRIQIDGGDNYLSGYYVSGVLIEDYDQATPVTVGPDGTTLDTISLQAAWKIQGSVTGVAGHLGDIDVRACPGSVEDVCNWAQTDAGGNFKFGGLAPGTYSLSFSDETGYFADGFYSDSGVTVPTANLATLITVPPSVSGLTVALTYAGTTSAPDAPSAVSATAGNAAATVSWTPGSDGGSAIAGYTVAGSDGSSCTSTTTSCTVTGLINGTAYTFTVTATNAVGTSDPSAPSDPVTPAGPAPVGAAKLGISGESHTSTAGANFPVTISALNKNGKVNAGYTGTVHFSSTDLRAGLPADYTFTAADAGVHTFTLSFATAGAQSITVGDGTLASRKWAVNVKPGKASSLVVLGPQTGTAGVVAHYKVMAVDDFGNVATDDTHALAITSSDPKMSMPSAPLALVHGKRAFNVTFKTAGIQSIQVADAADSSLVAMSGEIAVSPAKAVSISLTGLANPVTAGAATTVTATLHDRFGNVATGYVGTVHFTSNDKTALLPSDYTFTAADAGVHTFNVTLQKPGNRWITARDTSKHSIGGVARTLVAANLP